MRKASSIMTGFLRFACVLALVMVGFAHKPVFAYPSEAQRPMYQLPDGTFASLCVGENDNEPHTGKDFGCDACRLTNAILVPQPPAIGDLAIAFSEEAAVLEQHYRLARALYPPSSGPRAPPASEMFV